MATGNTVATTQGYPGLLSDDSGSEVEIEGPSNPSTDNMALVMGQLQQILAKQAVSEKAKADIQKKDTDQAFVKTRGETATPETQDSIVRVVALLEAPKQENSQEYYISLLNTERAAGRATLSTFSGLSKADAAYKKKL